MIDTPVAIQQLNTIEEAIADIKLGKVIIIVDDEDRENEGDFVCAAECITPEIINFMATHGRGLICTPINQERANELKLSSMVAENTDLHGTAFTVSIDYKLDGCTTGISAYDRATGIKALTNPETRPDSFARPGHIFPLIAREGGVLKRTGHTEATIDLATMAGFYPAGVLVEILNADGTMARLPQLFEIASKFDLKIISIKDLVAYRMQQERLVVKVNEVSIETEFGMFDLMSFKEKNSNHVHLVIKKGEWTEDEPILTRVHSGSDTAELFSFLIKSTGRRLQKSMAKIAEEGKGIILLLRYNESEDALIKTMETISEQIKNKQPVNPISGSNTAAEHRNIGIGSQILAELNAKKIRVMTNTPVKRVGLNGYGIEIIENVPF